MNILQDYHPALRYDGVDRDVCIPKSLLRYRERGDIVPVDKKIVPKKSRDGYAPIKNKIKDNINNDDNNNEAMDEADLDSKATRRTVLGLM